MSVRVPAACLALALAILCPWAAAAPGAVPIAGAIWTEPASGMVFVYVPGGRFAMGCDAGDPDCVTAEMPAREVDVDGFWLGRTEVSQGEWKAVMGGTDQRYPPGREDYPAGGRTRAEVAAFLAALAEAAPNETFRLPTGAEWERACRGPEGQTWAGTNERDQVVEFGWLKRNSSDRPHPVAEKKPNGYGLYDLSGNLAEMTSDPWRQDAYRRTGTDNPRVEGEGPYWTYRGGTYLRGERELRCARRDALREDFDYPFLGFRVVREEKKEEAAK